MNWTKRGCMVAAQPTRELAEHYARHALTLNLLGCKGASGWIIEDSKTAAGTPLFCAWLAVRS
jgi:hypothetical protein